MAETDKENKTKTKRTAKPASKTRRKPKAEGKKAAKAKPSAADKAEESGVTAAEETVSKKDSSEVPTSEPTAPKPATPKPATPEPAAPKSANDQKKESADVAEPASKEEASPDEATAKTSAKKTKRKAPKARKKAAKVLSEESAELEKEAVASPEAAEQAGDEVSAKEEAKPAKAPRTKAKRGRKPKSKSAKSKAAPQASEEPASTKGPVQTEGATRPESSEIQVIVASKNPAKIKAVELGFSRMFPDKTITYEGVSVSSGVGDQPMSDDETFAGALMRAQACRETRPEATYWVGLEGGLEGIEEELHAFAWMVILGPDKLIGKSRTSTFMLPPAVADLIHEGKELGEADDLIFNQTNSKHDSGAVGILTQGLIDRANYYAEAIIMALIPFKNAELYVLQAAEAETEL